MLTLLLVLILRALVTQAQSNPCDGESDPAIPVATCNCVHCYARDTVTERGNLPVNIAFQRMVVVSSTGEECKKNSTNQCYCADKSNCQASTDSLGSWGIHTLVGTTWKWCQAAVNTGCSIVNGFQTPKWAHHFCGPSNCWVSQAFDLDPWLTIDLETIYSIGIVYIYSIGYEGDEDWQYQQALGIYVGAQECYRFPGYDASIDTLRAHRDTISTPRTSTEGRKWRIVCNFIHMSRLLRLQKDIINESKANRFLSLCEVVVPVCLKGFYMQGDAWTNTPDVFSLTCTACPAQCRFHCDNFRGCNSEVTDGTVGKQRNVATASKTFSSSSWNTNSRWTAATTVDGVRLETSTHFCFVGVERDKVKPPFFRVGLSGEHVILRTGIYLKLGYHLQVATMTSRVCTLEFVNFAFRDNRPEDRICWTKTEPVSTKRPDSFEHDCDDCSAANNYSGCPTGLFVTYYVDTILRNMEICEVEVFGYRSQEQQFDWACGGGDCILQRCRLDDNLACDPILKKCLGKPGRRCWEQGQCINSGICQNNKCRVGPKQACADDGHCTIGYVCSNNKCEIGLDGVCQTNADCASDPSLACDYYKTCKKKGGATCSKTGDCVTGATCQTTCNCVSNARLEGGICVPAHINKTCAGESECTGITNLACKSGKCVCADGFKVFKADFSCKLDKGSQCTNATGCATGLTCNNGECFIERGATCTEDSECASPDKCHPESKKCLAQFGKPCTNDYCYPRLVCETICKPIAGEACANNIGCQTGFKCGAAQNGDIKCVIPKGEACEMQDASNATASPAKCERDAVCQESDQDTISICKVKVGNACDRNDNKSICEQDSVCHPTSNVCSWKMGGKCTQAAPFCGPGEVCDVDNICKIGKAGNCSDAPQYCKIRTYCFPDTKVCQCLPVLNDDDTCSFKPDVPPDANPSANQTETDTPVRIYSPCNKSEPDSCAEAGGALCSNSSMEDRCECTEGFAVGVDMRCQPTAGKRCYIVPSDAAEIQWSCAVGAVCDTDNFCKLNPGQTCLANERLNCKIGTYCDRDSKCRLNLNENCTGEFKDFCGSGLLCDNLGKCSFPVKGECEDSDDCSAGAVCLDKDNDDTTGAVCHCDDTVSDEDTATHLCKPKPGRATGDCGSGCESNADCVENKCKCKKGFETDPKDFLCKRAEGAPCTPTDVCLRGTVCDKDSHCRPTVGSRCNQVACEEGAVCDIDGVCKKDWGSKCDQYGNECRLGLVCDQLDLCKKGKDFFCNSSLTKEGKPDETECTGGSTCLGSKCVCDTRVSEDSQGLFCAPRDGRVGGSCRPGDRCDIEGAYCNTTTQICECVDKFALQSKDFSCKVSGAASHHAPVDSNVVAIVLGSMAGALGVLILVGLVRSRSRGKKTDALAGEANQRRASLAQLKKSLGDLPDSRVDGGFSKASEAESSAAESSGAESSAAESSVVEKDGESGV